MIKLIDALAILLVLNFSDVGPAKAGETDCEKLLRAVDEIASFDRAASLGMTGFNYYTGTCVTKNLAQAFAFSLEAAKLDDPEAQFNVAAALANGDGVQQDLKRSVIWAQMSAEQDFIGGQIMIATLLANGMGTERDLVEAYKWTILAARRDSDRERLHYVERVSMIEDFLGFELRTTDLQKDLTKAAQLKGRLEKYLSADQLADAKQRAEVWLLPPFSSVAATSTSDDSVETREQLANEFAVRLRMSGWLLDTTPTGQSVLAGIIYDAAGKVLDVLYDYGGKGHFADTACHRVVEMPEVNTIYLGQLYLADGFVMFLGCIPTYTDENGAPVIEDGVYKPCDLFLSSSCQSLFMANAPKTLYVLNGSGKIPEPARNLATSSELVQTVIRLGNGGPVTAFVEQAAFDKRAMQDFFPDVFECVDSLPFVGQVVAQRILNEKFESFAERQAEVSCYFVNKDGSYSEVGRWSSISGAVLSQSDLEREQHR